MTPKKAASITQSKMFLRHPSMFILSQTLKSKNKEEGFRSSLDCDFRGELLFFSKL